MFFAGEEMQPLKSLSFKLDFLNTNKTVNITPEGFLKLDAYVTRVGVFDYPETNTREYRPASVVLKKDSLDSMKGKSITFVHPDKMVDSSNYKQYDVGLIGENIRVEKLDGIEHVKANLIIKDKDVVDYILEKKDSSEDVYLSMGYHSKDKKEDGEHLGEKYDTVQTYIINNHVSIVPAGRAGETVKLKLDHKYNENENEEKEGDTMDLKELQDKLDAAIVKETKLSVKFDAKENENKELKEKLDSVNAEKDAMQAKLDASGKEKEELQAKLDAASDPNGELIQGLIAEKVELTELATACNVKFDAYDAKAIKLAIIKEKHNVDLSEKKDSYIDVYFDSIKTAIKLDAKTENNKEILSVNSPEFSEKNDSVKENSWEMGLANASKGGK